MDYFTKYDVALNGFAIWADWMRDRMCTWAQQLVAYHSLRGASIVYSDISKPKVSQDEKPKAIMTSSLNCLNELYQNYNQLARKALEQGDGQTAQFIEAHMINELLVDMRVIAEVNAKLQDIKDVSRQQSILIGQVHVVKLANRISIERFEFSYQQLPMTFQLEYAATGYSPFDDAGSFASYSV